MKVPIKSALSVALAMAASQAFALGLGPIQIKSGLNQPLLAEIPVVADSAAEAEDLRVDLASAEDFQRVGLSRARVTVPIDFTVANNGRGQKVIRLTTKEAVREPFLDFLIEASWSKGKLLREYTVLLDPPVTAPAVLATTTAKPAEKPKPAEAPPPRPPVSQPRAAETPKAVTQAAPPAPAPRAAPVAPPPAPTPAAAASSRAGEYTVQRGDTLTQIAHERGDDPRDFNRMLLALYKANPDAFYGANMNTLKTGAVLRIPTAEEVRAAGSLREAAEAVRAQYQSWQGSGAATLVANTGAAPSADKTAAPAAAPAHSSERLALVPPSGGAGSETGASRGGSGSGNGNGKDSTAVRADLARTKEALSSREQEASELKSRVNQLEDINSKSQRLISLKDSEIAELQNKLKQLEAAKGGAKAADTVAGAAAAKPAATAATPSAPAPTPAPAPAATPGPAPTTASTTPTTAAAGTPAAPASGAPTTPAASPAASTPPVVASTPAAAPTPAPAAAPVAAAPTPAPAAPPATAPKPPVTAVPGPATPAAKPGAAAKPWYADYLGDNPYALYGAGGILVLIAAWLASRAFGGKKKVNPRPLPITTAPLAAAEEIGEDEQQQMEKDAELYYEGEDAAAFLSKEAEHAAAAHGDDDEMEQLRRHFDDGDADRFVALAHSLHDKLPEDSDEWREVAGLGRQLLPGSPLFAEPSASSDHDGHSRDEFFFDDEPGSKHDAAVHQASAHEASNADEDPIKAMFGHDEPLAFEPHSEHVEESNELADLEFEREFGKHVNSEPAEPNRNGEAVERSTSLLDEDTIGTRLDLARAYLDMGDPEGARSMLDEVLAEGSTSQKEEARKLLAEIH